jgi:predicted aldo/keto reductase-like oxidoreductase
VSKRPGLVTLLSLAVALLVGYGLSGYYLWRAMIGLDPSAFPFGQALQGIGSVLLPSVDVALSGMMLAILLLLLTGIGTFVAVRASRRQQVAEADPERRSFLTGSVAGAGAAVGAMAVGAVGMLGRSMAGIGNDGRGWSRPANEIFGGDVVKTDPNPKPAWQGSRVQAYGRLGRTEWPVSDTVLGTGRIKGDLGEKVARLAIERGVNYIDTAPDYSGAGSENAVGRAISGVQRDQLFIATKWCTPMGHLPADASVDEYKQVIYDSLGRLGTPYVDLVHVHSCDEIDRLMSTNMHEAFAALKKEGKVRFLGFSTHTPNLQEVANAAIDSGKFDVMMLAYHHGIWPGISDIIARARKEQDMGVVAMKTLKGAKHHGLAGFQGDADSYAQAALKWVHSDPNVSCAVISFFDLQHVDEYLFASGQKVTTGDVAILDRYDRAIAGTYCTPHCGVCLDSCPEDLAINDVLRHRMYFEDYRSEQEAMNLYAKLEKNASVCVGCDAPCTGSCPYGVPIQEQAIGAHELLTIS